VNNGGSMKKKKIALYIMLTVCLLAVGIFAFLLIRELGINRQSQSFYSDIADGVEFRPRLPGLGDDGAGAGGVSDGSGGSGGSGVGSGDDSDDSGGSDDDGEGWVPYVDFEALNINYPGIVGWLVLEGSPINYPVMQDSDNDFFIRHLPDGTPHRDGSVFLDYRNESDFSDKSILIYGHMTRNHDMFGILREYRNREFYEANPVLYLYTPEKDYTIQVFAAYLAHSQRDHPPLHFEGDEFMEYVEQLKSTSFFKSDVVVEENDRIVSLCTCAYDFNEARLIITGVLVE